MSNYRKKVPRSPGKWNWNWLNFLPFVFSFEHCTLCAVFSLLSNLYLSTYIVEVEEKIILENSSLQVFKWQSVGGVNLSAIVYFIFATVGVSHLAVRVLGFKSIKNYIAEHNRNLFSKMSSIAFPSGFHLNPFFY